MDHGLKELGEQTQLTLGVQNAKTYQRQPHARAFTGS